MTQEEKQLLLKDLCARLSYGVKFAFTDRKDIVGYKGDSGRWGIGDKVKVYIKKFEPKKGL